MNWRRGRMLFTWQVAGPIGMYILVSLLVALYLALVVALHNGQIRSLNLQTTTDAHISRLETQLTTLQTQLRSTEVFDARKRGQLSDAIRALSAQIRQLGGTPVTLGGDPGSARTSSSPRTSSRHAQPSPTPQSSPTTKKSSPTPSPTCTQIPQTQTCLPVNLG